MKTARERGLELGIRLIHSREVPLAQSLDNASRDRSIREGITYSSEARILTGTIIGLAAIVSFTPQHEPVLAVSALLGVGGASLLAVAFDYMIRNRHFPGL